MADGGDALRDRDTGQAGAAFERIFSDDGDAVFDHHGLDAVAALVPGRTFIVIILHRAGSGDGQRAGRVQRPGKVFAADARSHGALCCGREGQKTADRRQQGQQNKNFFHAFSLL